jgi:hypothetical protein
MTLSTLFRCAAAASLAAVLLPAQGVTVKKKAPKDAPRAEAKRAAASEDVAEQLNRVVEMLQDDDLSAKERKRVTRMLSDLVTRITRQAKEEVEVDVVFDEVALDVPEVDVHVHTEVLEPSENVRLHVVSPDGKVTALPRRDGQLWVAFSV